ncbi:nuclear transport factor 2 family protein [Marinomonas sp. 2405UD68-3]|uniref:nuclear transport factor 2 family protein n=1 Tax=Marinomonas sp. 2405UD68-3 TaxID=3391835 RepID=UPI0039C9B91F
MSMFQESKQLVRAYFNAIEQASVDTLDEVMSEYIATDYLWRGVYPWREINNVNDVTQSFWKPLFTSIKHLQRRQDIFIAGENELGGEHWVMSMGNFMGLFDEDFLGIKATRKIINLRYAEFNCVENRKITKTGLFIDLIGLMDQAGAYPLPPSTGVYYNYPGPRNHDGLLFQDAPKSEGTKTLALINEMITDLDTLNKSGSMTCTPDVLEKTWSKNMMWYGPAGVGATYTIPRYQEQHQLPFRSSMGDKTFRGHECRFAEGNFACFFGWPNLSNTPLGGWLGLPGGNVNAEMQVVDIYCREGDKLSENWILIDIPYWLKQQGLDVLKRTEGILNPN